MDHGEDAPPTDSMNQADDFAVAFTRAMEVRDVSLTQLRRRLEQRGQRVSLSTLSYWRSGQRRPEHPASLDAVSEIEDILDLPPGRLRLAVGPSRRPGPTPPTVPFIELAGFESSAAEAIDGLGLADLNRAVEQQTVHVAVTVDAAGNDTLMTTRLTLKALTAGVDTYPIGLAGVSPGDRAELAWVRGAVPHGEYVNSELGIHAWHLRFQRPLRVEDTVALEFAIALPATTHSYFEYFVTRRVRELLLWVNFHPGRLPVLAEAFDSGHDEVRPLDVVESLAVVHHNYGPGTAGIRWTWPEIG